MEEMTDRLTNALAPRLAIPLALLALVGLLWLVGQRPEPVLRPPAAPSAALQSAATAAARNAESPRPSGAPGLFPAEQRADWLPPLAEDLSPVLAAGYPAIAASGAKDTGADTMQGPFLVAPSEKAPPKNGRPSEQPTAEGPEPGSETDKSAPPDTVPGRKATERSEASLSADEPPRPLSSAWPRRPASPGLLPADIASGPADSAGARDIPPSPKVAEARPPIERANRPRTEFEAPDAEETSRPSSPAAPGRDNSGGSADDLAASAADDTRPRPDSPEADPRPLDTENQSSIEKPPGLLMLTLSQDQERSEHIERIAREADAHTRRGFELAGRGAVFSARAEFIKALRLIAQGLDAEERTDLHSEALVRGLTALKEAEDFVPDGAALEARLDKKGIVGGHQTPVMKDVEIERMTALEILQCYFTYAQEQLGLAVRPEMAGSMALRALGKLHTHLASERVNPVRAALPKAMTCYQAALLANPANYMASNDLGVLLASSGRYGDARTVLEHSLAAGRRPQTLQNLIVVYEQAGDHALAQRARRLARTQFGSDAVGPARPGDPARVAWMPPQRFAQMPARPHRQSFSSTDTSRRPKAEARSTSTSASPPSPASGVSPSDVARRWPWDLLQKRK